ETLATSGVSGSAALSTTATTSSPVNTYAITVSQGSLTAGNYDFTVFTNGTLTVNPSHLTVTANNASRLYGDANPAFTGTISGILNGDSIQAQYSTTATAQSPAGTYPITATPSDPNGRLGNYSVTIQNGTLTVTDACTLSPPASLIATAISNA